LGLGLDALRLDLRYAVRTLTKSPGITALAVLALAVALGANGALFGVVDAVVLRPFPFVDQDRLMILWQEDRGRNQPFVEVSFPDFLDWRAQSTSFESMADMPSVNQGFRWTGDGEPSRVEGRLVSADFFRVLGSQPALGRTFAAEDDRPGADRVVVVGHGFWRRRLGGDPEAVGRSIRLDDTPFTVVGVMPEGFEYPQRCEIWTPVVPAIPQIVRQRNVCWSVVIGRLRPGVTIDQARTEMNGIVARLEAANLAANPGIGGGPGWSAVVTPLVHELLGDSRATILVLWAAVALVLLIACANVSALLLARAAARQREIAIRLALGAGRGRIVRQLLTESALVSLMGAAAGLLLATWGLVGLVGLAPAEVPRLHDVGLDGRAIGFTLGLGILTTLVGGLTPAVGAARPAVGESLKDGTRTASSGPGSRRARGLLVGAEVAIALVVLVGAGLLGRTFANLSAVDLGFDPRNVLTADVEAGSRYGTRAARREFHRLLVERVAALPGVRSAAAVLIRPLWGTVGMDWPFMVEGQSKDDVERNPLLNLEAATPGYFRTMGIRLLRGRDFTEGDRDGAPGVVIVSLTLAERYWPGLDPVGKRVKIPLPDTPYDQEWLTVVGVAGDARYRELQAARLDLYMSYLQVDAGLRHLVVKTEADPLAQAPQVRAELRALDPEATLSDVAGMDEVVARSLAGARFGVQLLGGFAAVALALAGVGIYGVMAHAVTQRTREMGVRMALGAEARDVLRLVVRQGMKPALAGLLLGAAAAAASTRLAGSLFFGVAPTDPATFLGAFAFLGLVALVAIYLPARRASGVDPVTALRYE